MGCKYVLNPPPVLNPHEQCETGEPHLVIKGFRLLRGRALLVLREAALLLYSFGLWSPLHHRKLGLPEWAPGRHEEGRHG